MKKIVSQILVFLFLAASISAQNENQRTGLVSEFGKTGLEDIAAQLDALAVDLSQNPNAKADIKIYGAIKKSSLLCHTFKVRFLKPF